MNRASVIWLALGTGIFLYLVTGFSMYLSERSSRTALRLCPPGTTRPLGTVPDCPPATFTLNHEIGTAATLSLLWFPLVLAHSPIGSWAAPFILSLQYSRPVQPMGESGSLVTSGQTVGEGGGLWPTVPRDYLDGDDWVPIRRTSGTYEVNVRTGEMRARDDIATEIQDFAGLPTRGSNKKAVVSVHAVVVSRDGSHVLAVAEAHDETQQPSAFDGSYPLTAAHEFLCEMADKTCAPTTILEDAFRATGEPGTWYGYSIVQWDVWDSVRGILYGHVSGEGIGSSSPVFIYDVFGKTMRTTAGGRFARVPHGAFNPSLDSFAMLEATSGAEGNSLALQIYSVSDLSKPKRIYDVTAISTVGDREQVVHSLAWWHDRLYLMTDRQVYVLNLTDGSVSILYTDDAADESGLSFDFNRVAVSTSGRYVVFVDFEKRNPNEHGLNTVLKAIDLGDHLAVRELLREQGLMLAD